MKNASDGRVSRLDTAKDRISELADISGRILEDQTQREQRLRKNRTEYPRTEGQL